MALRLLSRAVLLDAHGTLVELQPPAPALRTVLAERFGLEISPEQADRAIAAEISYYRAHLHEGRDDPSVDELRGRCSAVLRASLASEHLLSEISSDDFTQVLLASLQFRPYPEVPAVLELLRSRGIRVVVASNWDASLPRTLDALSLLEQVDGVVTSAECEAPKPDPPVFKRALELAGVAASEALHVGDSWEEDILGAGRVGIPAVMIVRNGGAVPEDARWISSLTQLLELPELGGG